MTNPYGIDWTNINLSSPTQKSLNIIDPLSFDDLLLEIHCNIPKINEASVTEQFETDLRNRIHCAREVFSHNLSSIVKHAQNFRKD